MKRLILFFTLSIVLNSWSQEYKKMISSGDYTFKEIQKEAESYFAKRGKGKGTGYKQFKRWEYKSKRKVDQNGFVKKNSFYIDEYKKYNSKLNLQAKSSRVASNSWEQLGPKTVTVTTGYNPGIGRITFIDIDKKDANHMIVGANTGGVWRTVDKGKTWAPLSDNFTDMKVASLAIHPNNSATYYWGSEGGEIYKSNDSGATWSLLGNLGGGEVGKIIINPNDPNIMFSVSTLKGIFKSINGGTTWVKTNTADTEAYDIAFKPNDYNTIYAAGKEFNRSTDGGETWSKISGFNDNGIKLIGVSPHKADLVYVIEEKEAAFGGLYISTDSGATFTKKDHTGKNYFGYNSDATGDEGQAPRDMAIAVSPTNSDEVHIAGIIPFRSLDGGTTFTATAEWTYGSDIGYCHADVDNLLYNGSELYVVSDGGVYVAESPAGAISKTFYKDLTNGMGIHQFYKIGVFQDTSSRVTGGAQDNGTSSYIDKKWKNWFGADGGSSFFHNTNSNIIYGTTQGGSIIKTNDGGTTLSEDYTHPEGEGNFITPFIPDPSNSETIYIGFETVFKSSDGGKNWTKISQEFPLKIDVLAVAPSNSNIMYASFNDEIYKTTTGSGTWTKLNGPYGVISDIEVHPTDANKVALTSVGSDKVFISSDGGATWVSKKSGLPNFDANTLVWQDNGKDGLYLGMSYGVYYIDNTMTDWKNYSNLLPNVMVNDLTINKAESRLYAGTYGRGVWRIPLYGTTLSTEDTSFLDKKISVYPNPVINSLNINTDLNVKAEIRVFSVDGKLVHYSKKDKLINKVIDISKLSSGIYFLRINAENQIFTKKIIKN